MPIILLKTNLFHVCVNGLHVFVFIKFVQELLDFDHLFVGKADGLVGETLQVGFHDIDFALFKGVVHGAIVGPGGIDGSRCGAFFFVSFGDDFIEAEVDEFEFEVVLFHAGGHFDFKHGLAREHEFQRADRQERAAALVEVRLHVGHGARGVVRCAFYHALDAEGAFAFVADFHEVGSVLVGVALDGGIDVVLGHVFSLGVLDGLSQFGVHVRVGTAFLGSDGNQFSEFREHS